MGLITIKSRYYNVGTSVRLPQNSLSESEILCLEENLNTSKPPEHSPSGGMSKYLGGNIGRRDKSSSCY